MNGLGDFDAWLQASRDAALEGRHAQGAELARRALALRASGEALALLALHQLRLGDLRACMASSQAALPLLQAPAQAAQLARAECTLAVACLQAEFVQQALVHAQRGASAAEQSGDALALAWCNNRLAQTLRVIGDPAHADALFAQTLAQAQQLGDRPLQFSILYNQAWVIVEQWLRGVLADPLPLIEALDRLERAQGLADANVHSQGVCLLNRSRCLQGLDRRDESRRLAAQALALGEAHGLTQLIVGAQTVLGEGMMRDGDAAQALQALVEARRALSEADLIGQIDLLGVIVKAYRQLGRFEAALDAFSELHEFSMRQERARADLQAWMLLHQQEIDRERQQRQRAELDAQLERLSAARWEAEAHHDPLTGLANRRFVGARLAALLAHGQQVGMPLRVAVLDLDHFKAINDEHGHELGDAVLRSIGALLLQHVRPRDTPARLGGEEFLVLLSDADQAQAWLACERLRKTIAEHPWHQLQAGLRVTVSIGLAPVGAPDAPWKAADEALYRAKASGRNRLVAVG